MKKQLEPLILAALAVKVASPERENQKVLPAFTVHALARVIDANASATETVLRKLQREGKVTIRHTRANDVLYKLVDKNHASWTNTARRLHLPGRSKGERPKVRVFTRTGW